jgi:hypothetical protein
VPESVDSPLSNSEMQSADAMLTTSELDSALLTAHSELLQSSGASSVCIDIASQLAPALPGSKQTAYVVVDDLELSDAKLEWSKGSQLADLIDVQLGAESSPGAQLTLACAAAAGMQVGEVHLSAATRPSSTTSCDKCSFNAVMLGEHLV